MADLTVGAYSGREAAIAASKQKRAAALMAQKQHAVNGLVPPGAPHPNQIGSALAGQSQTAPVGQKATSYIEKSAPIGENGPATSEIESSKPQISQEELGKAREYQKQIEKALEEKRYGDISGIQAQAREAGISPEALQAVAPQ